MVCCRLYFLSCGCFDILYSHFPVTSSRIDQFSGTYLNKLYLRNPSGYVLLWLKTGGRLNSVMSCLLQNVDIEQSPPRKKKTCSESYPFFFTTLLLVILLLLLEVLQLQRCFGLLNEFFAFGPVSDAVLPICYFHFCYITFNIIIPPIFRSS